jgi:hypothetical protein
MVKATEREMALASAVDWWVDSEKKQTAVGRKQ